MLLSHLRLRSLTSVALATACLVACGGGGGSSTTGTGSGTDTGTGTGTGTGSGSGSGSTSSYYVYGFSATEGSPEQVQVVDPAAPGTVVLSSAITGIGGATDAFATQAITVDSAAGTLTRRGEPLLFFVRDRQLQQVALSKPGTPAVQRISSLSDACQLWGIPVQLDSSGLDAWVGVMTAGADGDCSTYADNRYGFARSGSPTTTDATLLPLGTLLGGGNVLTDATGRLLWILALDRSSASAPKLVAYDAALNRIDVAGGAGVSLAGTLALNGMNGARLDASGAWLQADGQLRRLTGDATSLTLGPSAFTHTAVPSGLGPNDGDTLYLPNDNRVVQARADGTASVLATLPTGSIHGISQTATHVLVYQIVGSTSSAVRTVRKSDGAVQTLLTGGLTSNFRTPLGLDGDTLFYSTAGGGAAGEVRQVKMDGTGDALVASGVIPTSVLGRTVQRPALPAIFWGAASALTWCVPAAGASDCRNGSLRQFDLATRATTTLGSFAGSAAPVWTATVIGYAGQPGATVNVRGSAGSSGTSYARRELWLFNPGEAGSLTRVSSTMP